MPLREPTNAEECVYLTNRYIGEKGAIRCWVFRGMCPKCGKGLMGKPRDSKGKVKIRAKEFICPACSYAVDKAAYESTLTANIVYTCPKCENESELQIPFRRKKVEGVDALVFSCQKCGEKIPITKKMKELGKSDGE